MEVLQAAEFLVFAIPTGTSCPQVTFELMSSTRFQAQVDQELKAFNFEGKVRWPPYVKTGGGTINIQIMKKVHGNWSKPLEEANDVPKDLKCQHLEYRNWWPVELKNIKYFNPNVCEITVKHVERVHNYLYPGHYVKIALRGKGRKTKAPFYPTIKLPFHNLSYPNKSPYEYDSAHKSMRILVNDYGRKESLQYRICHKRPINDSLYMSGPTGGFCPSFLEGVNNFQILCESTGIGPALSVIMWTLHSNPFSKVNVFYFNHEEKHIIYKDYLDEMASREKRFTISHILKKPRKGWGGWKGAVELTFLQKLLSNWTSEKNEYAIAAGHRQFVFPVSTWLKERFGYPQRRVYRFMTL